MGRRSNWRDEYIEQRKKGCFFEMPNAIFRHEMKPIERCVYFYLVCASGMSKYCYPSMKTIAKYCGCSSAAARKATQILAERGFIKVTAHYWNGKGANRQANNRYDILPLPAQWQKEEPEGAKFISEDELKGKLDNEISEIYKDQLPETVTA